MLSEYRKAVAAIVAAIVSVGGISVILPGLDAGWAATITGVVSFLAVLVGPKNEPAEPTEDETLF